MHLRSISWQKHGKNYKKNYENYIIFLIQIINELTDAFLPVLYGFLGFNYEWF